MIDDGQKDGVRFSMEILFELNNSLKHFDFDDFSKVKSFYIDLLENNFLQVNSDSDKDWSSFFKTIFFNDIRRFVWILDFMFDKLRSPSLSIYQQSLIIKLLGSFFNFNQKYPSLHQQILPFVLDNFKSDFDDVRLNCARYLLVC